MVERLSRKSNQKMLLIDDFLPEGDLKEELWDESLWVKNSHWRWQNIDDDPINVFEQFSTLVWKKIYSNHIDGITGWEYWTKALKTGNQLGFHQDNNTIDPNDLKGQPLKFAKFSFSYLAQKELPKGGYLLLQRQNGEIERIQPKPNRLVIFDSETFHTVSLITEGIRSSLISVAWDEKPWHYGEDGMNLFENTPYL